MRIAINCRSILRSSRTGIGRYTYHLIDSLGQIDAQDTFLLYARKGFWDRKRRLPSFAYKNFTPVVDLLGLGPQRLLKGAEVYHVPSPDLVKPISGMKLVVTVHDLIYKVHPESHTPQTIEMTERFMASIVRHADKIICVSENTRQDLHKFFDLPSDKTCVVHHGVDHAVFYPLDEAGRIGARARLKTVGVERPFILFVGTIEPRKNLNTLLKSFALLKGQKAFNGQLVVVGMKGWMTQEIAPLIRGLGLTEDIVFTGFISDAQLRELYDLAEVFVFPSLYEGFGFPILEAFCCGVPVVTSNTSSCSEVAGEAALLIDPRNEHAMAQAIGHVLTGIGLKAKMRENGLRRAQEFSFKKTALETMGVYAE